MKAAVVVFPGTNRENDIANAIALTSGTRPAMIWHGDSELPKVDLIVIPGGFSYGDYLRCGAMAAHSPVMREVKARAEKGVRHRFMSGYDSRKSRGKLQRALDAQHGFRKGR